MISVSLCDVCFVGSTWNTAARQLTEYLFGAKHEGSLSLFRTFRSYSAAPAPADHSVRVSLAGEQPAVEHLSLCWQTVSEDYTVLTCLSVGRLCPRTTQF